MHHCGAIITFRDEWIYPKQCKKDRHVMDVFMDSPDIAAESLTILNCIQYYVKPSTIAELAMSN
eukprot:6628800-Ditylum_brightwellii.AAC.1